MSTTGRRTAREDATIQNVKQASLELDNIVDGIIRKGHKVTKAKLNKQRDSSSCETSTREASEKEREGQRKSEDEDRQVVRLRFSGSTTDDDGRVAYVYMKRKAIFHPHMDEVRLVSDPEKQKEPLLKVKVSRCADPDWTHMTILMMDRNERVRMLMAVVDLECRGDEARAVRINGLPVAPVW